MRRGASFPASLGLWTEPFICVPCNTSARKDRRNSRSSPLILTQRSSPPSPFHFECHAPAINEGFLVLEGKICSAMSTAPTPPYYAPSTTGTITTTWLPLTTTYLPSQGDCDSNFWAFQDPPNEDQIWAWLPDSPNHSWGLQCLPPAATLSYLAFQSFIYAADNIYSIGPFIGCPNRFTAVTTSIVSGTSSQTICCPT